MMLPIEDAYDFGIVPGYTYGFESIKNVPNHNCYGTSYNLAFYFGS